MLRCLTTASYVHLCDVLTKDSIYDAESYTIKDVWVPGTNDVKCVASPFINGGIKGNGSMEKWDEGRNYISNDYVRIKTKRPLLKSERVTNIRSLDGTVVWREEEFNGEPTVFNVDGCAPVPDPITGKAIEYVSTLSRAEIQRGG